MKKAACCGHTPPTTSSLKSLKGLGKQGSEDHSLVLGSTSQSGRSSQDDNQRIGSPMVRSVDRRVIGGLVLSTNRTGCYVFRNLSPHDWPPETKFQDTEHNSDTRVAGNSRRVGPVDNQAPQLLWNIQPKVGNLLISCIYLSFNLPGYSSHKTGCW